MFRELCVDRCRAPQGVVSTLQREASGTRQRQFPSKIRGVVTVVSHAWRSWKHARTVGLVAIVALAVGIGSTTAVYTVVHGVMFAPLPYANGDRFVALYGARFSEPGWRASRLSPMVAIRDELR